MEEKKSFIKLGALVDREFTIEKVTGYKFKKWDQDTGRMRMEDSWFEGARKMYQVETDRGLLDLSEGQIGSIFAKVQHAGQASILNLTVAVKSNGKSGIDIRYYLNPVAHQKASEDSTEDDRPW